MYSLRDTKGDNLFKNKDIEKDENGEYKNQIYSVFNTQKNLLIERFNRTSSFSFSSSSSFGCSIKGRHSGYICTEDLAVFLHQMPFLMQPTDSRET